jgi:hypothetical protein
MDQRTSELALVRRPPAPTVGCHVTGENTHRKEERMTTSSTPGRATRTTHDRRGGEQTATIRFEDHELLEANSRLEAAFGLLNCLTNPLTCPECGTSEKGKVNFKGSKTAKPYWKCFKCSSYGSATKLLQDKAGMTFVQAVNTLLGRDTTKVDVAAIPRVEIEPTFEAVVDPEVYDAIRDAGSVEAAQRYWAMWHIHPDVVADAGSTMLTDPDTDVVRALLYAPQDSEAFKQAWRRHVAAVRRIQQNLAERFGMPRLRAAGVVMDLEKKKDHFLINEDYPVLEPHTAPTGNIVGMQFRPVGPMKAKIDAHKAWKRRWEAEARTRWPDDVTKKASDAWQAAYAEDPETAGPKHEYKAALLSLRGAGQDSLVGCGLHRIAQLPPGSVVLPVEGYKDHLAVRTCGAEAYGVPGTGNMPPLVACRVLEPHKLLIAMDGDAAGAKGAVALDEHFKRTLRVLAGILVAPDQIPQVIDALQQDPHIPELLEDPVVNHRADGNVWVTGRPYPHTSQQQLIQVIAAASGIQADYVLIEQRGVHAEIAAIMRPGMDGAETLVERVAHLGCGCPTCTQWRAGHPAERDTCPCAVCEAVRAGHPFDNECRCPACMAVKAQQATLPLIG